MKKIFNIVKIGGSVTDNPQSQASFLKCFAKLEGLKILVHGGGKKASSISEIMGLQPQFIEGRRITDADTLEVATMVYGGLVNKNIVAILQSMGVNAMGMSGADANIMTTRLRDKKPIDFGFVGDFYENSVNKVNLLKIVKQAFVPIICSLTHDGKGQLLNTNADTIAERIATTLRDDYIVKLHYCFEHLGILGNLEHPCNVLKDINRETYAELKESKIIHSGLIPKVDSAFKCASHGVEVRICHFSALLNPEAGTKVIVQ